MCLITAAPKGVEKKVRDLESFIRQGMSSNTHGSGFAYKKSGTNLIFLHKGFNTASSI